MNSATGLSAIILLAVGSAGCNSPDDFIGSDPCPLTHICVSCGRLETGQTDDISLRAFRPWEDPPALTSALLVRLDPGMRGQRISAKVDGRAFAVELPPIAPFAPFDHVVVWNPPLHDPDQLSVTYDGETSSVDVEVISVDLACEITRGLTDSSDVGS